MLLLRWFARAQLPLRAPLRPSVRRRHQRGHPPQHRPLPLAFPSASGSCGPATADADARGLIPPPRQGPAAPLGSHRGAADVKSHPFF
ncbi:Os01g0904000 [Oryza sativa Japonica Group]|uniref:Os01g0904000 protein n=1 Tax=Oryza sativa subsp. japonica TaxID=39947 RepID=A0A0P0VBR5_ORYSJ|nr:hypothetical protein EE612_007437 [Oryza sativa]BAS75774.1 Os01g0904000 [Oryza sativa Japonica Group]